MDDIDALSNSTAMMAIMLGMMGARADEMSSSSSEDEIYQPLSPKTVYMLNERRKSSIREETRPKPASVQEKHKSDVLEADTNAPGLSGGRLGQSSPPCTSEDGSEVDDSGATVQNKGAVEAESEKQLESADAGQPGTGEEPVEGEKTEKPALCLSGGNACSDSKASMGEGKLSTSEDTCTQRSIGVEDEVGNVGGADKQDTLKLPLILPPKLPESDSVQGENRNKEESKESNTQKEPLNLNTQTDEAKESKPKTRASKGHQRRGLMSAELYNLFIRYITTEQMPTDLELTVAKFEKANDSRKMQQKPNWQTRPPNCKTAAKFRHWAKSLDLDRSTMELSIRGKIIVPREKATETVLAVHCNDGDHLSLKNTVSKYSSKYTMGRLAFGVTPQKLRKIIHKCPEVKCQAKLYMPYVAAKGETSSSCSSPDTITSSLPLVTPKLEEVTEPVAGSSSAVKKEKAESAEEVEESDDSLPDQEVSTDADHTEDAAAKSPRRKRYKSRGKKCIVPGCSVYQYNNEGKKTGAHFFQLPSKPSIALKWEQLIGREGICSLPSARICEKHFKPSDLDWTISGKLRRRPSAVPCRFPLQEQKSQAVLAFPSTTKPSLLMAIKHVDEQGNIHYDLVNNANVRTASGEPSQSAGKHASLFNEESTNKAVVAKTWKPRIQVLAEQLPKLAPKPTETSQKVVAVVPPRTLPAGDVKQETEKSVSFPTLSAVPLTSISPERPQSSSLAKTYRAFSSASNNASNNASKSASNGAPSSASNSATKSASSSAFNSASSSTSNSASNSASNGASKSTVSGEEKACSSVNIGGASSNPSGNTGGSNMPDATVPSDSKSSSQLDFLQRQRRWLKAAIEIEALKQKNLEEELRLGRQKLEVERLRLVVQEQRMKRLAAAQKQAHMKRELLKTIRNRQLAGFTLEEDSTEESSDGGLLNEAALRKDADTASDVKSIVRKIEQELENASMGRKKTEPAKQEHTSLNDIDIRSTVKDCQATGSLKRKAEEQMPCQSKRRDTGEGEIKIHIDLTRQVPSDDRKEGLLAPAPCHVKGTPVLFRSQNGQYLCTEVDQDLLASILRSQRTGPQPLTISSSDSEGVDEENCIVKLYDDLLGMIREIGQDIPKVLLNQHKSADALQKRLSNALAQVKKCAKAIPE